MCQEHPAIQEQSCSQTRVNEPIDVAPDHKGINWREVSPSLQERFSSEAGLRQGAKLGDTPSGLRDRDQFPASCAIHDFTALVAQVPNADFTHAGSVSRVIHEGNPLVELH